MVVSGMTHSTGKPLECLKFSEIKEAAVRAISIVWFSNDSLIPLLRPSMIGRIPILGRVPHNFFWMFGII